MTKNQMKKILLGIFMLCTVSAWSQHVVTSEKVLEKDRNGGFLMTFKLDTPLNAQELATISNWAVKNESLFQLSIEGTDIQFVLQNDHPDRNYFLKAFSMMNVTAVKTKKGSTLTVEEFLTNNKL